MVEQKPPLPRRLLPAFSRYRPRALTLVVLFVVAALLVLANLTRELRDQQGRPMSGRDFDNLSQAGLQFSNGWPFVWRRQLIAWSRAFAGTVGWEFSLGRLAGNIAIWAILLAAPGIACERFLRRRPLRLRWSLRSMLVAVGVGAVFCAWFATVRNRANLQDPLFDEMNLVGIPADTVWLERWGPKWLSFVGADRYCRSVVGAQLELWGGSKEQVEDYEKQVQRLARLRTVQYLFVDADRLTPGMVNALGEMTRLKTLAIEIDANLQDRDPISREFFAALGNLSELERLDLAQAMVDGESITRLADLPKLKSLRLAACLSASDRPSRGLSRECLAAIGKLTSLERLELVGMEIDSEGLAELAGLTNLKSLALRNLLDNDSLSETLSDFDSPPALLGRLPPLPRLEVLALESSFMDDRDLSRLVILPRLRSLSLLGTHVSGTDFSALAKLESLEELAIEDDMFSAAGLETLSAAGLKSLLAIKRLKALHIDEGRHINTIDATKISLDNGDSLFLSAREADFFCHAMQMLRQARPEIVLDCDFPLGDFDEPSVPREYDRFGVYDDDFLEFLANLPPLPGANLSPQKFADVKW